MAWLRCFPPRGGEIEIEFPGDPGAEEFNLDVETEFNDVAVFHDVILALDA